MACSAAGSVLLGLTLCTGALLHWSCAPQGAVGALSGGNKSSSVVAFPSMLYVGENDITLRSEAGLKEIRVDVDAERPNRVIVKGTGDFPTCPEEAVLRIRLETEQDEPVQVRIKGKDCLGNMFASVYLFSQTWSVERIQFADVNVGEESCREFRVTTGYTVIIDSVTVPDSLPIRLGFSASTLRFPLKIPSGKELAYTVCFTGEKPGTYIFPVIVWIRREQPTGPLTNYPVTDTGRVKVKEK